MPKPKTGPPKRPFRSLVEWREANFRYRKREKVIWPCLECSGSGSVVVEYGDCYEGRNTYGKCPVCKGEGEGHRQACKARYDEIIRSWKEKLAHYREVLVHWKSAQKKLTSQEKEALEELRL
jgi:hypothetical protein